MRNYDDFIKEASAKQLGKDAWGTVKSMAPFTTAVAGIGAGGIGVDTYRRARKKGLSKKDAMKCALKEGGRYTAMALPTLTGLNALSGVAFNGTNELGILNPHLKRSK